MTDPKTSPAPPDEPTDVQVVVAAARQPAYDAVYALIRRLPNRGHADVVRNAIIWRAVTAALDAMKAGMCVSSHCAEGDHVLVGRPHGLAIEWALKAMRSDQPDEPEQPTYHALDHTHHGDAHTPPYARCICGHTDDGAGGIDAHIGDTNQEPNP